MRGNKTERISTNPKHVRNQHLFQPAQVVNIRKEEQEYQLLCNQIKHNIKTKQLSKHTKIRLLAWLQRLDKAQFNRAWRQNRKIYLKLLNLMIDCQYICHPFLNFPPKQPLQIMQKHQVNQIINQIQKAVKQNNIQSRKNSHFMKKQSRGQAVSNYQQASNKVQRSHRKVSSISNDSIKTLSVSQEMAKKLSVKRNSAKLGKQNKKDQPTYKNSLNIQNCSFQTSKFAEIESFSNSVLKKYKKKNQKASSPLSQAILNNQQYPILVSEQLKRLTDSIQFRPEGKNVNHVFFPNKSVGNKKVVLRRSPRFNDITNNWSEKVQKKEKELPEKRYWQSSSLAEVGTPRYLNLYPINPYPSLALSDQHEQPFDKLDTTRSKQNCCSNCLFKLWSVS